MTTIPKLTTTSYAVLGLLAIQPWSSYELTRQIQRSLNRFWPRAESKLYEEPKKLVRHGLATCATEHVGRRQRSVYTITDTGRQALATWLGEPAQPPGLESEHLLKVFLADHGTREQLLAVVSDLKQWAEQRAARDAEIARNYLAGEGEFPERAAVVTLIGRYSADFAEMTRGWAEWVEETVSNWPEDLREAPPPLDELDRLRAGLMTQSPDAASES